MRGQEVVNFELSFFPKRKPSERDGAEGIGPKKGFGRMPNYWGRGGTDVGQVYLYGQGLADSG